MPLSHILPRGHQLLNSVKVLELRPKGRIVTPTPGARLQGHIPLKSLEPVRSVSTWGIVCCFGFLWGQCLGNWSLVVLCLALSFYLVYKFKILPQNWY